MKKFKKLMLVGMMALVLIGVQATSHALTLGFSDGIADLQFVTDNGPGDLNPLTGGITYIGSFSGAYWTFNLTTGLSKPILGSASSPYIFFDSVSVSSGGSGQIYFGVVETGFIGPISGGLAGPFDFTVTGTAGGTALFYAFGNNADNNSSNEEKFFAPFFIASLGSFGPGTFEGTTSGSIGTDSSFGLGIVAGITHTGAQTTWFDAGLQVQQVPEPSVLLLVGVGLVGIWGFRKKVKK